MKDCLCLYTAARLKKKLDKNVNLGILKEVLYGKEIYCIDCYCT